MTLLLINDSTRNHVVLICLSKLVTKEGFFFNFEGACLHSEAKRSLVLRTLHVFLMLQVAFLSHRLNAFLLMDVFFCQMMVS